MQQNLERAIDDYDTGRLSRRQLLATLAGIAGAAAAAPEIFATPTPAASTFTGLNVNHVALTVSDVGKSREFYEGIGFTFVAGPLGPEPVAILDHPSGVTLNLILNGDSSSTENVLMDVSEKYPGYTHMALSVRDVELVKTALEDQSVTITEGPVEFPGARALFIRDPDGNVIEFNQHVPVD